MSFEALAYVKQIDLGDASTGTNHLLLRSIAENTFNDSGLCRLSQKQLAAEVHCTCRHLRRLLADLETLGVIARHKQYSPENGGRRSDTIELVGFTSWMKAIQGVRAPIQPERVDTEESAKNPIKPDTGHIVRGGGLADNMSGGPRTPRPSPPGHSCPVYIRKKVQEKVLLSPLPPRGRERGSPNLIHSLKN